MKKITDSSIWLPLAIAVAFIGGMICNNFLKTDYGFSESEKKFRNVLNLIENEYVDEVDIDSILEATIPHLFETLDPHSLYIPAEDLQAVNEELDGSFSGVGIQFTIANDTIAVIEAIAGGPSERAGLKAGDRIIAIDGENMTGTEIETEDVFSRLRGEKDTKVRLTVKRNGVTKPLEFEVIRGEIPVTSIDAAYIATPGTGYIRVNKFGRTTYDEFWQSLNDLDEKGADKFIIDLRGNSGGFMEMAILMVNEFVPRGTPIVYTIGRRSSDDTHVLSDGTGSFQDNKIIVLIDEFSASASEIFAGAIQDNDRGLIIGRRSFGKGLVQRQIDLNDSSAIRLTIARYYTPSGRCIQKDYSDTESYENDIIERYNHGEAYEADSIKFDPDLSFITMHGRTVYGGGGIMPDIFIPNDTAGVTNYYINVANAGLFPKFSLKYTDNNRERLEKATTTDEVLSLLPADETLLQMFVKFCAENGIVSRWYYINKSHNLIINRLKAFIARDVLGFGAYVEITNRIDPVVLQAIERINSDDSDFPLFRTE